MKQATPEQIVAFLTGGKMTDITERLDSLNEGNRWPMMSEAAKEIRGLRSELDEAKEIGNRLIIEAVAKTQHVPADWYESLLRDSERLRAALKLAGVALDTAECVIDADGEVEAFHQVQTAHKAVKAALEPKP